MTQYYIYLDNEQKGPYAFEEVIKQIKADTLVWHQGMADWQRAETIEEFKIHFKSVPPPVTIIGTHQVPPIPSVHYTEPEYETRKILGIKRNYFLYGVCTVIITIGIFAFSGMKQDRISHETMQNQKLEKYNEDLKAQQKIAEEQKRKIEQQEKRIAEQERIEKEKKIFELNEQLSIAYHNLENAKRKLNDATAFQLLRSNRKRHREISDAENVIKSWEEQIRSLEKKMELLGAK